MTCVATSMFPAVKSSPPRAAARMKTNRFFKTVKKGCFVKVEETKRAICNFGQRQVSSSPKQLRPLNRITFNCSRINQFWRDRTLELCSDVFEITKLWLSFYTKRVWFMCLKVHLLVRIPSQDDLRGVKRLTRACRQGEREIVGGKQAIESFGLWLVDTHIKTMFILLLYLRGNENCAPSQQITSSCTS